MKKEVLIAILIGFGIGLIITFGIYRAQRAYQANNQTQSPSPTPDTLPPADQTHNLTITNPIDTAVVDQDVATITGTTSPGSFVTAVTSDYEAFTQADPDGNFTLDFQLEAGANLITLTSLGPQSQSVSRDLTLIYSTADLDNQSDTIDESDTGDTDE